MSFLLIVSILAGNPSVGLAGIIAFTNFDEPAAGANDYAAGTNAPGHELGFTMGDSDPYVDATKDHTDMTLDVDGNDTGQSYYLSRPGTNKLIFDTVDLTGYTGVNVSLWLYVPDKAIGSYGTQDDLTITVVFGDVTSVTLLDITGGAESDDNGGFGPYMGQWSEVSGDIPDSKISAYLKIANGVTEGGEDPWVDDVFFVPEPATIGLMGAGLASLWWLRRKRQRRVSNIER